MAFRIFLSIVLLAGVVYFALAPQSSKMIRLAAIGALGLMIVTLVVCLIIFISAPEPQILVLPGTPESEIPPPPGHGNDIIAIISILILLVIFAAVLYISQKQQQRESKDI